MIVRHTFQLFCLCPFDSGRGNHDFYDVIVELDREVDVHVLEERIKAFAIGYYSQEDVARMIAHDLQAFAPLKLEVHGKHSANSSTSVIIDVTALRDGADSNRR